MSGKQKGVPTFLLLLLVLAGFIGVLWVNSAPPEPLMPVIPTQATPTAQTGQSLTDLLKGNFGQNTTPLPTPVLPTRAPATSVPLIQGSENLTPVSASDLGGTPSNSLVAIAVSVTPPPPTLDFENENADVPVQEVTREAIDWQPPPLIPPLSRDPLGLDTYWLQRPVDANANNAVLNYYSYGSDGADPGNPLRVHHGIDMPNRVGERVSAAADGIVTWAADGRQDETAIFQNSPSYGNVIVIRHNFGFKGKPVYTLYAHLSASFVEVGQEVKAGQAIGQVGNSGRVSGPHVHFEVRLGEDPRSFDDHGYKSTYNPILWMVPYVGHGVIAGTITDDDGNYLMDADITIRNRATGLVERTTTSYVFLDTGFDVNSHPNRQENFAVTDIPVGRYDVIADIFGQRIVRQVTVVEGTTAFVALNPPDPDADDD